MNSIKTQDRDYTYNQHVREPHELSITFPTQVVRSIDEDIARLPRVEQAVQVHESRLPFMEHCAQDPPYEPGAAVADEGTDQIGIRLAYTTA